MKIGISNQHSLLENNFSQFGENQNGNRLSCFLGGYGTSWKIHSAKKYEKNGISGIISGCNIVIRRLRKYEK